MKTQNTFVKPVFTLLLLALSSGAFAVDLSSSRTNANTYSDGVSRLLPLNNAGSTSLWVFFNNVAQRALFYNAECAVRASDDFTWYNINIEVVNPAGVVTAISPTNSDNAFCTSKGNNVLGNYSSNLSQGTYRPTAAGWHRVQVRGQLIGYAAGESVRLDDVSLIVTQ